mmetsp:Transcript_16938/g.25555  ORF Transcript_16938/g.25555 Transcript_16938/m.25555 type:complete len:99 (+) Transcript_16938:2894-3190(+)
MKEGISRLKGEGVTKTTTVTTLRKSIRQPSGKKWKENFIPRNTTFGHLVTHSSIKGNARPRNARRKESQLGMMSTKWCNLSGNSHAALEENINEITQL